jgi:hypothetical protein
VIEIRGHAGPRALGLSTQSASLWRREVLRGEVRAIAAAKDECLTTVAALDPLITRVRIDGIVVPNLTTEASTFRASVRPVPAGTPLASRILSGSPVKERLFFWRDLKALAARATRADQRVDVRRRCVHHQRRGGMT